MSGHSPKLQNCTVRVTIGCVCWVLGVHERLEGVTNAIASRPIVICDIRPCEVKLLTTLGQAALTDDSSALLGYNRGRRCLSGDY
jgi:hypothetical protein